MTYGVPSICWKSEAASSKVPLRQWLDAASDCQPPLAAGSTRPKVIHHRCSRPPSSSPRARHPHAVQPSRVFSFVSSSRATSGPLRDSVQARNRPEGERDAQSRDRAPTKKAAPSPVPISPSSDHQPSSVRRAASDGAKRGRKAVLQAKRAERPREALPRVSRTKATSLGWRTPEPEALQAVE